MAKVICKLPNASELINGVKFATHKLGMLSEDISDEAAEAFTQIKGYTLYTPTKAEAAAAAQQAPASAPAPAPAEAAAAK